MKFLKYLLFLILALLLIYLLLCAFGPKNFNTTRTAEVNAPAKTAFNLVNNLQNWEKWSPWLAKDTSMVMEYGDKKEGVGAWYTWKGNDQVGSGKLEIIESELGKSLKSALNFDGFDGTSNGVWSFEEAGDNKTNVSWGLESPEDLPFMMRGMMMLVGAKGSMEKDFDAGLASIKEIAEARASGKYDGYQINNVDLPEKHYVMHREEIEMQNMQQFYTTYLGSLFGKVQAAGAEMDGMPCGLFFKWDEANGKTDMAASIPVKEAINIQGASSYSIPAGKALQVDYYGPYGDSAKAHYAIDAYMKDNGHLNNPPVIEQYVTDPSTEEDPNKVLTQITYYLAE